MPYDTEAHWGFFVSQSAQICGGGRGEGASARGARGERDGRKSDYGPAGCSRDAAAEKKKLSRRSGRGPPPFERSGIPARAPGGARPMRGASIARDRPEYRSCTEKRAIETRGGGKRVRTPLSRCCCSSRKMAAASGDAMPRLGDGGRVSARLTRRRALSTSQGHVQPGRDRDACAARSIASDAPVGLRAAASVTSVASAQLRVAAPQRDDFRH